MLRGREKVRIAVPKTSQERRESAEPVESVTRSVCRSGSACVRAFGSSMQPAIHPGDLLLVREAAIEHVAPGEVVLFRREGRLFAHRVRGIVRHAGQFFLVTKGDALEWHDRQVTSAELIGRVVHVERDAKRIYFGSWARRFANRLRALLRGRQPYP